MRPRVFMLMLLTMPVLTGCLTPAVIANTAGFLSGTGYLAVNNPPAEEVKAVKKVLGKVDKYVVQLKPKDTFASLYKPISIEIGSELSGTTKILALSVTRAVLDGLDNLFAAHSKWAEKKDLTVSLTRAFSSGVNRAFDMFAGSKEVRANMARLRTASAKAYRSR